MGVLDILAAENIVIRKAAEIRGDALTVARIDAMDAALAGGCTKPITLAIAADAAESAIQGHSELAWRCRWESYLRQVRGFVESMDISAEELRRARVWPWESAPPPAN